MLEARGLGYRAGERWILQDFDLRVETGHITAVLGANGQGKSTLLRVLTGVLRPSAGNLLVEGEPFPADPVGEGLVGAVLEQPAEQLVAATVEDEMELTLACAPRPSACLFCSTHAPRRSPCRSRG